MNFTRLSKSRIWDIMHDYYNHMGPDAWKKEIVPSDMSSNKYLANIYVELILASVIDWQNNSSNNEPIHIIEIGAGHGRFGFYILKLLSEHLQSNTNNLKKNTKIKYIMTDITKKKFNPVEKASCLKRICRSRHFRLCLI